MTIITRHTPALEGIFEAPSSKSEAVRAIFFALLSQGTSQIHQCLSAEDVNDAIQVCRAMGASIIREGNQLTVISEGPPFSSINALNTGNSGLTTRFLIPLLGLRKDTSQPIQVDCGEQMKARPMHGLFQALRQLGMTITPLEKQNTFPIEVSGKLQGGTVNIEEPISQYLSSLIMALPLAENDSHITLVKGAATPYIDMTLAWLDRQKIQYTHHRDKNGEQMRIPGRQHYPPFNMILPGDFSSASYFIAAGIMFPGQITLKGLNLNDQQGDKKFIEIAQQMGARILMDDAGIHIQAGNELKGTTIDARETPDLLPTLAVLGTHASGKTTLIHAEQARLKETDRIHAMCEGLSRMGATIEEKHDGMIIHQSALTGASVNGYNDHRTVMAFTLAGMLANGETTISDSQAIHKTFPEFISAFQQLGGNITTH